MQNIIHAPQVTPNQSMRYRSSLPPPLCASPPSVPHLTIPGQRQKARHACGREREQKDPGDVYDVRFAKVQQHLRGSVIWWRPAPGEAEEWWAERWWQEFGWVWILIMVRTILWLGWFGWWAFIESSSPVW